MPDRRTEDLGRVIFDLLRCASALQMAGDGLMKPLGLTAARWQILATAAHGEGLATVSDLARQLSQARQSVQRVVDELATAGLIELRENPAHARARLVALTEAGRGVLARAELARIGWTEGLAAQIGAVQVDQAAVMIGALRKALGRA